MAIERTNLYDLISRNKMKSILLVIGFIVLVALLGWLFGELTGFGIGGLFIAGLFSSVFAIVSYYWSDKIALSVSGAQPADEREFSYLHNTVEGLAIAAGIPKPAIYIIDDPAINAFATGRDPQHAAIAVTTGALTRLNRQELEGVIAHELSHVKNYDIRFSTLVVVLVGIVVMLSDLILRASLFGPRNEGGERRTPWLFIIGLLVAVLAPLFAQIIRMAVSRQREFLADADGAMLSRNPAGLASALKKIGAQKTELQTANAATAHLYISNPLKGDNWFSNLFSTHPPIEERVARLESLG